MLLDRFLPRIEFDSYEDFKKNYKVNVPENFNFGFDIVDEWASRMKTKRRLFGAMTTMRKRFLHLRTSAVFPIRQPTISKA